ncbi:MAG TPA: FAD-dependent oxidoreductase [Bacteroidia bacterium]|nr:FAD-dependent oxidoreductase [Bacteroidia bacterium]
MNFDFIIVGQGIAGSLLGYELIKAGKKILILDIELAENSSKTGAGIMHPVTGRRMVKQWKADTLIPFAKNKYRELEKELGNKLFYEVPILEIYTSVKNRNDWAARSSEQGLEEYLGEEIRAGMLQKYFKADAGGILIKGSGYVDMEELVMSLQNYFQSKNAYSRGIVTSDQLIFEDGLIKRGKHTASKIIFCEGYGVKHNSFFSKLPFLPVKGEILEIFSEELPQDYIVNREMYILPTGNHHFKAGATYEWDFENDIASEKGKKQIDTFLKKFLNVKYEITEHRAAIRPSTQDRRPYIGLHPVYPHIGIFNGLGTKGAMLAPYFAKQFADFLIHSGEIENEVNVNRITM